ncbi:MAG TPA: hypothetical protein GXX29_07600 [Firmicutes bacterium]|nr:hypothetical protein [Bacillota bacterium]
MSADGRLSGSYLQFPPSRQNPPQTVKIFSGLLHFGAGPLSAIYQPQTYFCNYIASKFAGVCKAFKKEPTFYYHQPAAAKSGPISYIKQD